MCSILNFLNASKKAAIRQYDHTITACPYLSAIVTYTLLFCIIKYLTRKVQVFFIDLHRNCGSMDLRLRHLLFICLCFTVAACDSRQANTKSSVSVQNEPITDFQKFAANYEEIKVPYLLPDMDNDKDSLEIDKRYLENYFKDTKCRSMFSTENDVPELKEDMEDSSQSICYVGKIKGEHFIGLITRKISPSDDKDDSYFAYYYLTTFTPDGKFIDATCIAYDQQEGKDDESVRKFEIKSDNSIEIVQQDIEKGIATNRVSPKFLEIDPDGHINNLTDNPVKTPL